MHKQFLSQTLTLVTTAFGLIAALAWNTAITTLVKTYFPSGSSLVLLFLYALLVTVLAVVVGGMLARAAAGVNPDGDSGK